MKPWVAAITLLVLAGCWGHTSAPKPASTLSEAQRDSAIARSSLPGASTVGRALALSGQATGYAAKVDSVSH